MMIRLYTLAASSIADETVVFMPGINLEIARINGNANRRKRRRFENGESKIKGTQDIAAGIAVLEAAY